MAGLNPLQTFSGNGFLNDTASLKTFKDDNKTNGPYAVNPVNWYKSLPYGFSFSDIDNTGAEKPTSTIWLPISPSNLVVNTHFATNIITTLYGIVEEHSEVRYYDITIQGNTGIAPRFVVPSGDGKNPAYNSKEVGRKNFEESELNKMLNKVSGGFLPEVTNTISQVANVASNISDAINGIKNETGVFPTNTGYLAFHNLYKFLLRYKQDTSRVSSQPVGLIPNIPKASDLLNFATGGATGKTRKNHPLQFLNYKDGIKYDVVPISFTMTKSADNPMVYNYSIRLRGFNLRNVTAKPTPFDRLSELGLGGIESQSLFASMTSIAGNAATLVSAIL